MMRSRQRSQPLFADYTATWRSLMRTFLVLIAAVITVCAPLAESQQDGPYKVLKTARVGGEGGWDYIYADADSRRLYIPRGATRAVPATDTTPAVPAVEARVTSFPPVTLKPVCLIARAGANGAALC